VTTAPDSSRRALAPGNPTPDPAHIPAGRVGRRQQHCSNSSATGAVGSPSPILIDGKLELASGTYNPGNWQITSPQFLVPENVFLNRILPTVNVVGKNGLIIAGVVVLPHQ
jgi:hypothetical protein